MQLRLRRGMAIGIGLAAVLSAAWQSLGQEQATETLTVSKTYNNAPFDYRMRLLAKRSGFRVYRLTYPSPVVTPLERNNAIPADFYVPEGIASGDAKRPAVICLHILNGDMHATDLACSALALRGIPAIMIWLPYYGDREPPEGWQALMGNPKLFLSALIQAIEDVRRTVDLLASRSEINPERIGITGFSLGGIVAASAAGTEPRLYRTSLFLAGGDLFKILHHASYTRGLSEIIRKLPQQEQLDLESKVAAVEPLKFAPALRARAQDGKVLMINAAADEIIPRACTERLAAALGIADRVVWMNGFEHGTFLAVMPQVTRQIVDFFAQDLPAGASAKLPPAAAEPSAFRRVSVVLQQAASLLSAEPEQGRCHCVEMELAVGPRNEKPFETRLRFVRGAADKFALKGMFPTLGDVTIGQGKSPWMVIGGKEVLLGVRNPVENRDPLGFVDQRRLGKLRLASGIVGSLALVPDALGQWVAVQDEKTAGGGSAVRVTAKQGVAGSLVVSFQEDGQTPSQLAFNVLGTTGTAVIRDWRVNAAAQDSLFDPPAGLPQHEVDQADLYRAFSVAFNLAASCME